MASRQSDWSQLVGKSGDEAKSQIESEGFTVQVLPEGSMTTMVPFVC